MAATWEAIGSRSVKSAQAATEAAPTDEADGMSLVGVAAITFRLEADEGQTIGADTGQVDVYLYDAGAWAESPAITIQVPAGSLGARRINLATVVIDNARGRLAPIANGINVTGGGVTLYALATAPGHSGQIPV